MIITDKDGNGWAFGDCSDIGLAHVLLEEDDNTCYVGIQLKGDRGFSQIPFATKEEAEIVLKQIDARMEAARNYWNPAYNVPYLATPQIPPLPTTITTTNLSQQQPDVTSGQQYVNNYPNPEELNKRVDKLLATSNKI